MKRWLELVPICFALAVTGASTPASHPDLAPPPFADVSGDAVWGRAVSDMARRGFVHGTGAGFFAPDEGASRAEMAVLLLRAAHGPSFSPAVVPGDWWEPWVREAQAEGFMVDVDEPTAPATRADVVVLMWLMQGP